PVPGEELARRVVRALARSPHEPCVRPRAHAHDCATRIAGLCVPCQNSDMARRHLVPVAALAAAVFCSCGASGTASGLHGTVMRGPIAPVCRKGVPCAKPAARVVVRFELGDRIVATAKTDAKGRYKVVLGAGDYSVRVPRKFGKSITPQRAVVRTATMRR